MARYVFKPIDEVRNDVIGLKVIDVEPKGRVLHLEDSEGRIYSIDFTGENGAVVHAHSTNSEELEMIIYKFNLLLEKLGIDEEELLNIDE